MFLFFAVPAQEVILSKIDKLANFILVTPISSMIGTDLLQNIMQSLHDLKEQQKRLISGITSVSDILTKMMFVLAPLVRLAGTTVPTLPTFFII